MNPQGAVFDPETVQIMDQALNEAMEQLPPSSGMAIRGLVAQRIVHRASQGERDPVRLRAYALAEVVTAAGPLLRHLK